MKIFIILTFSCISFLNEAISQAKKKATAQPVAKNSYKSAVINISFDEPIDPSELKFTFYDRILSKQNQRYDKSKQINAKRFNGNITFETGIINKIGYISLAKKTVENGQEVYMDMLNTYLVEPGDNVTISVKKDSVYSKFINKGVKVKKNGSYNATSYNFAEYSLYFSGKGSAKFQCRYEADRIISAYYAPDYSDKSKKILCYHLAVSDSTANIAFGIFSKYKNQISDFVYQLLKAEVKGRLDQEAYIQFQAHYLWVQRENTAQAEQETNNFKEALALRLPDPPNSIINYSIYYPTAIIERQKAVNLVNNDSTTGVYYYLKKKYRDVTLDRLLTVYLTDYYYRMTKTEKIDWETLLKDGLATVQTMHYSAFLYELQDMLSMGKPAYNFSLPDINGNVRKLEEFKGKIVFIDFFYKECGGCQGYYINVLSKVEEEFADNKDVVFITISIDKDKKKWLEGVYDNKHTSLSAVNLYTGGQGTNHPVIEHYKVIGYPRPLLIDQEGKIFNSSSDLRDHEKLVQLINSLLNKKEGLGKNQTLSSRNTQNGN
ncbi:MAG TPA: TlpA disulfide reductase family protein [Chitinophagaceae bacterium]|jgi:cytochrome oxidase Cu insertion factor (SCO1/SenC/PrrC family)|nr:TlpA disulfide reductase family protein [Chitinophagaceae bacterium]